MELGAGDIASHIRAGVRSCFGIEWEGDRLVRDRQEPEPGFFRAWLAGQTRTRH